jgi:hypothetical protein
LKRVYLAVAVVLVVAIVSAVCLLPRGVTERENEGGENAGGRENQPTDHWENWEETENEVPENVVGYRMMVGHSISYQCSVQQDILGTQINLSGTFTQTASALQEFQGVQAMRWDTRLALSGEIGQGAGVRAGYGLSAAGYTLIDENLETRYTEMRTESGVENQENTVEEVQVTLDYENMVMLYRKNGEEENFWLLPGKFLAFPTCLAVLGENLKRDYSGSFVFQVLESSPVGVTLETAGRETVTVPGRQIDCWKLAGSWEYQGTRVEVNLWVSTQMNVVARASLLLDSNTDYGKIMVSQEWRLLEANWL